LENYLKKNDVTFDVFNASLKNKRNH